MTDLTREAIDRKCQIRITGCGTGPCCLCHFRIIGQSGLGLKNHDLIGAWGCHHCHGVVDSDKSDAVQLDFAKGVFRTIDILIKEGKVTWD